LEKGFLEIFEKMEYLLKYFESKNNFGPDFKERIKKK
jgi:hypothetical protein